MSGSVMQAGNPKNLTASAAIAPTAGYLIGFYVNNTSSGTLILKDGGTGGTAISGTITPAIGFHCFPATFATSPYATIGGTLDVTFFWVPTPVIFP